MKMQWGFKKVVWGYVETEGKDIAECKKNFEEGEWIDEYDNKSEYEFDAVPLVSK